MIFKDKLLILTRGYLHFCGDAPLRRLTSNYHLLTLFATHSHKLLLLLQTKALTSCIWTRIQDYPQYSNVSLVNLTMCYSKDKETCSLYVHKIYSKQEGQSVSQYIFVDISISVSISVISLESNVVLQTWSGSCIWATIWLGSIRAPSAPSCKLKFNYCRGVRRQLNKIRETYF